MFKNFLFEILLFLGILINVITFSKQPEISSPYYFMWLVQFNFTVTWCFVIFVGMVISNKNEKK